MQIDEKALQAAENAYLQIKDGGFVPNMRAALEAYESAKPKDAEGWRDIASAPTPVMIGSSFGLGRDYDKLVWFHAGVATHWRPLPEPPSAMLSAAGGGE
jgi:hypothetical protein